MRTVLPLRVALWILTTSLLGANGARGAYLTDWNAANVISISDPVNLLLDDSQDITHLWYRLDSGTVYFRMDLRGAPTLGPNQSAPDYMILINSTPGGAANGDGSTDTSLSYYVGQGASGIDQIVDGHFQLFGGYINHHHEYPAGANSPYNFLLNPLASVGGVFQATMNGGATLEWAVPAGYFDASTFTFYGSAEDIAGGTTFNLSGPLDTASVPEPGTMALMTVVGGLSGLVLRRFKKKDRA